MYKSHPFRDQLRQALEPVRISFHVPGHKYGQAQRLGDYPLESHYIFDTTELPGTDNLHEAEGIIQEAQERAAAFYGSRESFFLVNGTTAGILAMILAAVEPGETILMGRDCHQSAYHGAYLAQAEIRWLMPEYDAETLLNLGIRKENVAAALKAHPEIKAVVLTYPTYFGICSDIRGIAEVCRAHHVLLLVDEAHGAHFPLSSELPVSALAAGADITVQSTHKTLPALTQSSMLHVGSDRVSREKLRWMLRMVQSSSPSYLLMQSLDQAVTMAARTGMHEMNRLLESLHSFREKAAGLTGLLLPGKELVGRGAVHDFDPTKIILNACGVGISGSSLSDGLREKAGIQMELSTPWYALGIATIGNSSSDIDALGEALSRLMGAAPAGCPAVFPGLKPPAAPESRMKWREALSAGKKSMLLTESAGEISGAMVTPYPPGIPLLMPGEIITAEALTYLQACRLSGISVIGLQGAENETIQVVTL